MQFGISILSVIPIRELPSDKSEMTTQLIFGEHYKILEQRKKWSRIKIAHDKYTGWISNNQIHIIYQEEYDKLIKK
jgi:Bacterial SH3 domain.